MIEANLNLQLRHKQVYCLHSSARSVHNFMDIQLYTYQATLGATSSVAEFDKVCTQIEEKLTLHLGSAGHLILHSSVTECDEVRIQF